MEPRGGPNRLQGLLQGEGAMRSTPVLHAGAEKEKNDDRLRARKWGSGDLRGSIIKSCKKANKSIQGLQLKGATIASMVAVCNTCACGVEEAWKGIASAGCLVQPSTRLAVT